MRTVGHSEAIRKHVFRKNVHKFQTEKLQENQSNSTQSQSHLSYYWDLWTSISASSKQAAMTTFQIPLLPAFYAFSLQLIAAFQWVAISSEGCSSFSVFTHLKCGLRVTGRGRRHEVSDRVDIAQSIHMTWALACIFPQTTLDSDNSTHLRVIDTNRSVSFVKQSLLNFRVYPSRTLLLASALHEAHETVSNACHSSRAVLCCLLGEPGT